MELQIQQGKIDKWLRVPITVRAEEIVRSLDHRLSPWDDKSLWVKRDLHNQRDQCIDALWRSFGGNYSGTGSADWGRLERGRKYCKPDNIPQHTFRHTFAMRHLNNGTPLEALKDLLGHMDIRMTQVYASKMTPETLRQYVR